LPPPLFSLAARKKKRKKKEKEFDADITPLMPLPAFATPDDAFIITLTLIRHYAISG
jgi:hypothetical protein